MESHSATKTGKICENCMKKEELTFHGGCQDWDGFRNRKVRMDSVKPSLVMACRSFFSFFVCFFFIFFFDFFFKFFSFFLHFLTFSFFVHIFFSIFGEGWKHAYLHVITAIVCVVAQLKLGLVVTTLRP